jgi:hypothetical protein
MKTVRIFLLFLSLMFLASVALADVIPNYLVMTQQAEKWYLSEGSGPEEPVQFPPLRMHSRVNGVFNGAIILEREIWEKDRMIESDRLLYTKDPEGNIHFFGDLDTYVLEDPILWVDAPLILGKHWRDKRLQDPDSGESGSIIHYFFVVQDRGMITCPAGTFPAHCVHLTMVYPDGHLETESFWYNTNCGMVMCTTNNERCFELLKVTPGVGEIPDIEIHDPAQGDDVSGLKAGPNPLNPMTTISFELKKQTRVDLRVYDIAGKLVRTLVAGEIMEPGTRSVRWNGKDDRGSPAASGTYIYRLQAGDSEQSNRVTLIR